MKTKSREDKIDDLRVLFECVLLRITKTNEVPTKVRFNEEDIYPACEEYVKDHPNDEIWFGDDE